MSSYPIIGKGFIFLGINSACLLEVFSMDKIKLRKKMVEKLKSNSKEKKQKIEQSLVEHVIHSNLWNEAKTIGLTISKDFEWNTESLIRIAWEQGKTVAVPKCFPKSKKLVFYKMESYKQLENVYHDLWEPDPKKTIKIKSLSIDLLIVPGLLFDKFGFRIGFGGGYYDRFLTQFPNQTLSLTSRQQLCDELPADPFDIPVNNLITENGLYKMKTI